MKTKYLKETKAITLIALVVTIVVLLILAGVSIAILTGENGILNRATEAKTTSEIAKVEELANLELANSLIGVRAGLQGEAEKTLPEILTILEQRGDIGANSWKLRDDVTIASFNFGETTSVSLAKGGSSTTLTATFIPSEGEGAYYIIIEGKKYPISKENGRITIGKTEIKTNSGSEKLTGVTSTDDEIASATITGKDENQIRIETGDTVGKATITVSSGNLTPINLTVMVLNKYTVTVEAGENGTVSPSGEQEVIGGNSITVTATGNTSGETKYKFASWSDGTTTYTTSNQWTYTPTGDVTLTATFVENTLNLGAEITIGTQKFYVIKKYTENNVDKVALLSKYNLATNADTTTGKYVQSPEGYNSTKFRFSNYNYWITQWNARNENGRINLNNWEDNYNSGSVYSGETTANNAILRARQYATDVFGNNAGAKGRLLTYGEAKTGLSTCLFGGSNQATTTVLYGQYTGDAKVGGSSGDGWLYYWLASSNEDFSDRVWFVDGYNSDLYYNLYNYSDGFGVRPVIEVPESAIQ